MIFQEISACISQNYSLDWDHILQKMGFTIGMVLLKDDPTTHPDYKFLNVFVTFQKYPACIPQKLIN